MKIPIIAFALTNAKNKEEQIENSICNFILRELVPGVQQKKC